MMSERHRKKSRFLSWVLRHAPGELGLDLDAQGWVSLDALVAGAARHGTTLTPDIIADIVASDDKGRYELDPAHGRVRARFGHSVAVDLEFPPLEPPPVLYHGTAARFLASVRAHGLRPQNRQQVHLSVDREGATAVGRRHGVPVVLEIDARVMHAAGFRFRQAGPQTWLVERVPVEFIDGLGATTGQAD